MQSVDCEKHGYAYEYDKLRRLKTADYNKYWNNSGRYSMNASYDRDGNIQHLQRYGVTDYTVINSVGESCEPRMVYPSGYGLIDDLTYSYNTNNNTLQNVTDAANIISNGNDFNGKDGNQATYGYDNGNLISDSGKDLNIAYNFLEQPKLITTPEGRIELTYDALGNKLQKRVYAEGFNPDNGPLNECVAEDLMNQQDYLLDFVYRWHYPETKPNSTEAKFRGHRFYHEEGSIEWRRIDSQEENAAFVPCFQYTIRDHLGNGRVYFTKDYDGDGLLDVLQESHYYPFGAQLEGVSRLYDPPGSVPNASNGYVYQEEEDPIFIEYLQYTHDLKRYNGKEYNRELGLNWYDYGARWYDPVIGRWNAVDPLAEKYYGWNSYNYVLNNPLALVDPDGRSPNGGQDPYKEFAKSIEGCQVTTGGTTVTGAGGATVTKEATKGGVIAALMHYLWGDDTTNKPDTEPEPKKDPKYPPVTTKRGKEERKIYRELSFEDREAYDSYQYVEPKGTGGNILEHVAGLPTKYISASETKEATRIFKEGNGLAEKDVNTLKATGSTLIEHPNVLQGVRNQKSSNKNVTKRRATHLQNAVRAQEVLIKGGIHPSAIKIIEDY